MRIAPLPPTFSAFDASTLDAAGHTTYVLDDLWFVEGKVCTDSEFSTLDWYVRELHAHLIRAVPVGALGVISCLTWIL